MNLAEMLAMADQATQGIEVTATEFTPIPPGTYDFAVTGAEGPLESVKTNPQNPAEHGQYLKLECTIVGGAHNGRKIWMNNNIICYPQSLDADAVRRAQTAMAIGGKERKILLDSVGKTGISTAAELVGATFSGVVATEKGTNGYKDKSVIKTVKPSGSAKPAAPSPFSAPTPSAAPSAPAARNKMPWEK